MDFNLKAQRMLYQLYYLYELEKGFFGTYELIYDHLIEECHNINFSQEEKNKMWQSAQKRYSQEKEKNTSAEIDKENTIKYYKSELVKRFLWDKYKETGMTLKLYDQHGNKLIRIKELSF
jgi:hypothetical protein